MVPRTQPTTSPAVLGAASAPGTCARISSRISGSSGWHGKDDDAVSMVTVVVVVAMHTCTNKQTNEYEVVCSSNSSSR